MDPITIAIVAALGKLSEQAIQDAYNALKLVIVKKFGADGRLFRSVKELEEDPNSEAGKMMIKEQVTKANALHDHDVLKALEALQTMLEKSPGTPVHSTVIKQQAGDNALQVGQIGRDLNIRK